MAYDGTEAVEIFEKKLEENQCENCVYFKYILMDLNMPMMDGAIATKTIYELMEKKGIDKRLVDKFAVICVSAYTDDESKNYAFANGIKLYMNKPVVLKVLTERLKDLNLTLES